MSHPEDDIGLETTHLRIAMISLRLSVDDLKEAMKDTSERLQELRIRLTEMSGESTAISKRVDTLEGQRNDIKGVLLPFVSQLLWAVIIIFFTLWKRSVP